ncbi:hypothetical protein DelCs14_2707 [Delftia sp. Cs1-4]|uniref:hypothetical protein n=1 Tax=Delftia sp. (strain Cs1-4) TaxID=742013 RepID=UPI00020E82FF|nr:hypothetical protein [Delftia sp. Cs1-4]AEF89719.1 hypothetical protein DelCs14_2707 [Delftia sp. Cs1-4]
MATTGIAMQGLSAAIVYTAIDKIGTMINDAAGRMQSKIGPAITQIIDGIPDYPEVAKAKHSNSLSAVLTALGPASVGASGPAVGQLPLLVEQAVGTFFTGYSSVVNDLFPGLLDAGADADAWIQSALTSAVGTTYIESVDRVAGDTAFALARKDAWAGERDLLDAAAASGHRFAPGATHNAIARLHAESTRAAADAIAATHAARLREERETKMRLVRAELDQRMDRIKQLHQQTAQAFRDKLRARGLWISDQDAVIDSYNRSYALPAQFNARLAQLAQEAAQRHYKSTADALQISDVAVDVAKLKMANGQEIVDFLGNMITTLNNQVRASGSYSGSERDVTDWDSILNP